MTRLASTLNRHGGRITAPIPSARISASPTVMGTVLERKGDNG